MFHLIFSLPAWYVIVRVIYPLSLSLQIKIVLSIIALLATQYLFVFRLMSGGIASPELPRMLIIGFNWAFGVVLFLTLLQLCTDIVMFFAWLVRHPFSLAPVVRGGLFITALILSTIGVHQAIRVPPVKDVTIYIRDLPKPFEGYQLLGLPRSWWET